MFDTTRDVVEAVGLLALIVANVRKLYVLQRNTRRWNGLGKAMRAEKAMYALLFTWLLLISVVPVLNHTVVLTVLAVLVVTTEVRVTLMLPDVTVRHDDEGSEA